MFRKYASLETLEAFQVPQNASRRALRKAAHRVGFEYEPRPGYLYVRSRAISSRCNDNHDEFPADEIKAAYRTFIGKPVFVNHHNDNHRRARGVIIDAALHEDRNADGSPDTWAEVLMEVDAVKFPKLAKAILAGEVDRTSMGCDVQLSVCSACGNKASNPAEYCHHIPAMKGQRIFRVNASTGRREGHLVREICHGLGFFENSLLVEEPADPTAYFLGVDDRGLKASASRQGPSLIDFEDFVDAPNRKHAVSDDEIQRGLNLPKAEDTHREVNKMKGKDLAESLLAPMYEPYGGHENYMLHQHNEGMMALKRRYEGNSGKFGFDHEDDGGEPYYEIKHPSGWTIRHYADGPHAEIRHRATPDESHEVFDIGDPNGPKGMSEWEHPPENFGHKDLKALLDHWHSGPAEETGGAREYLEGQHGDPRIRRWKRTMGSRKQAAHTVYVDQSAGSSGRMVTFKGENKGGYLSRQDGKWMAEDDDGRVVHEHRSPDQALRGLADHHGLTDELAVHYEHEGSGRRKDFTIPAKQAARRHALHEVKAPPDVDTLRDEECPVCGDAEIFDGERCPICGFIAPPSMFRDPDLEVAKQMDLRGDQIQDGSALPGGGGLVDPEQLGPGGTAQDAADQLQHPDQLNPNGAPMGEPGTPGDGIPDLFCPACGEGVDAGQPMSQVADDTEATPAAGPEEGMPCPNCGMATLLSSGDMQQMEQMGEVAGQDAEGAPISPDELPQDGEEEEAVPGEEEAPPGEEEDAGAEQESPPEDEDPDDTAVDDEDPAAKKRDKNSKGASMSKAVEAAVKAQAGVIDGLQRANASLQRENFILQTKLAFLAKVAGVEEQFDAIQRHADMNNPAAPIPDPPSQPAYETTEQALAPETMDNVQAPGETPGSVEHVPAEQVDVPMNPGVTMPQSPVNQLVDVTAPTTGTNGDEVPLNERRIETDVRIGEDPLRASGPGVGGIGNEGTAFPWTMSAKDGGQGAMTSNRAMASLRLARLRKSASLAQGDEFAVAAAIEGDANLPDIVLAHEIRLLEAMNPATAKRERPAGLVPRAAAGSRKAPSMASLATTATNDLEGADDSDLFLSA